MRNNNKNHPLSAQYIRSKTPLFHGNDCKITHTSMFSPTSSVTAINRRAQDNGVFYSPYEDVLDAKNYVDEHQL